MFIEGFVFPIESSFSGFDGNLNPGGSSGDSEASSFKPEGKGGSPNPGGKAGWANRILPGNRIVAQYFR